jgi:formylglycine-generating enzyme required for sulfatase activity
LVSAYLDFDVEIGEYGQDGYPVMVRSRAGEARELLRFPFDRLALESRLDKIQIALLRSAGPRRRRAPSVDERAALDFGAALFDALMAGEVGRRYDVCGRIAAEQEAGLRLRLRIQAPELAALPWEYLYDRRADAYLCLSRHTPVIRCPELPQPVQPFRVAPPLRVLGVLASPPDLPKLDLETERERIARALQGVQAAGLVEWTWLEGQTWRDVQRAMRSGPWHILHFLGHGGFDEQAGEGVIYLADEAGRAAPLRASQLGQLLSNQRSLRLAVLNACEGGRASQADVFSSTAAALIRKGIPAVLAMQYEISDAAAVELGRSLYEALADGLPVDAAVAEARQAVYLSAADSIEWGVPVLYLRAPDGVLFDLQAGRQPAPPAKAKKPPAPRPAPAATPPPQEAPQPAAQPARKPSAASQPATAAAWSGRMPGQQPDRVLRLAEGVEMTLVHVPAGPFRMGTAQRGREYILPEEQPAHQITLPDYWIGRTPVTNAQYQVFTQQAGHRVPEHWKGKKIPANFDEHPVVNISWDDAIAFCDWLRATLKHDCCLPSEAEWEKAARGTDGREYPWGDWKADHANTSEYWEQSPEVAKGLLKRMKVWWTGINTTPVGKFSPQGDSPYGCADMAGNVDEWTRSVYKNYPYKSTDGRENLSVDGERGLLDRVLRGGSFGSGNLSARSACRHGQVSFHMSDHWGFRVAARAAP